MKRRRLTPFPFCSISITQEKVNSILREKWYSLSKEDKKTWKRWEQWDAKRYAHQLVIYNAAQESSKDDAAVAGPSESEANVSNIMHVPKKRKPEDKAESLHIPKKARN